MNNSAISEIEIQDGKRVNDAILKINSHDFSGANNILLGVIKNSPQSYVHTNECDGTLYMRFWDQSEFVNYVNKEKPTKKIFLANSAYPRAYYFLGFIAVAESRYLDAIGYLDAGFRLEPTNPKFISEKAHALSRCGRFSEALSIAESVSKPGPYVSEEMFAMILRSRGSSLIELGRVREASDAFKLSLQFAPNNQVALNELKYIQKLGINSSKLGSGVNIDSTVSYGGEVIVCKYCGAENPPGAFGAAGDIGSFVCNKCKSESIQVSSPKKSWQFWKK